MTGGSLGLKISYILSFGQLKIGQFHEPAILTMESQLAHRQYWLTFKPIVSTNLEAFFQE